MNDYQHLEEHDVRRHDETILHIVLMDSILPSLLSKNRRSEIPTTVLAMKLSFMIVLRWDFIKTLSIKMEQNFSKLNKEFFNYWNNINLVII